LLGVDVSAGALERAARRLRIDDLSERRQERVALVQGALTYLDERIKGHDVATLIEVIEQIDPPRLEVLAQVLFGNAAPCTVIVTTPNREYNTHFEGLEPGALRHGDHRFEWTRDELGQWAAAIAEQHGYQVELSGIGPSDPVTGSPTQMAVFRK